MDLPRAVSLRGWCERHLEVTATAGRARAAAGTAWLGPARAAWRYVAERQRPDGAFGGYWWCSRHYPTFQAVELAHAMRGHADVEESIASAAGWAAAEVERLLADGGAEPACFALSACVAVLARAGVRSALAPAVRRLRSSQRESGDWPAQPILRIPHPATIDPDATPHWRVGELGTCVVVPDQHRLVTTATCVGALSAGGDA
jgi:hypothetical protein